MGPPLLLLKWHVFCEHLLLNKLAIASGEKFLKLYKHMPSETMLFVIPTLHWYNVLDKPHYHLIQGQELLHVQWDIQFSDISLSCHCSGCTCDLISQRSNLFKNKKLFPVFNLRGFPTWCIVMSYQCSNCNSRFNGNDGRLLVTLPPHLQDAYPVNPRYAMYIHLQLYMDSRRH